MDQVTLDEALETAMRLDPAQGEILVEILRRRQIETEHAVIARAAQGVTRQPVGDRRLTSGLGQLGHGGAVALLRALCGPAGRALNTRAPDPAQAAIAAFRAGDSEARDAEDIIQELRRSPVAA